MLGSLGDRFRPVGFDSFQLKPRRDTFRILQRPSAGKYTLSQRGRISIKLPEVSNLFPWGERVLPFRYIDISCVVLLEGLTDRLMASYTCDVPPGMRRHH